MITAWDIVFYQALEMVILYGENIISENYSFAQFGNTKLQNYQFITLN